MGRSRYIVAQSWFSRHPACSRISPTSYNSLAFSCFKEIKIGEAERLLERIGCAFIDIGRNELKYLVEESLKDMLCAPELWIFIYFFLNLVMIA